MTALNYASTFTINLGFSRLPFPFTKRPVSIATLHDADENQLSFSAAVLGVLAVASGIYTYLGVTSLLDDNGALSFFAAISYSIAVSVGIFVFWSYLIRLLPAVRTVGARLGLFVAMLLGSAAIIAVSS
ncbi:hypothetical protein SAMN04488032_10275 [Pacificibacter marinus]|uniref:Uncharacterized protein n=1 Tax=Pacificibacter marinus TaxID=658057 RepID=A0A1Y5RW08_9RHOB|nr:hypothetical protein SAMN04488032_10275 [Pacificibacter marinus]SLN26501.1 hypothetical protein PAM7971_01013 [Pacificibacter marinus]